MSWFKYVTFIEESNDFHFKLERIFKQKLIGKVFGGVQASSAPPGVAEMLSWKEKFDVTDN